MRALIATLTLSASIAYVTAAADAPSATAPHADAARQFSIAALPLSQALRVYAEQSGDQIVFYSDVGKGRESTPVDGKYTPQQALQKLLENTGLKHERVNPKTVAIQENEAQGVEIDANLLVAGSFAIDLNATWQDTEIQNGPNRGNEVGRQPPYQLRLTPSYTMEFGDGVDATLYATLSVIDDREADDANTQTLDGYEKVDLGVLVNVSDLSFQLAADNVTDEEALTEGDPRNPTSPNARFILPRSFKFTVGYHF